MARGVGRSLTGPFSLGHRFRCGVGGVWRSAEVLACAEMCSVAAVQSCGEEVCTARATGAGCCLVSAGAEEQPPRGTSPTADPREPGRSAFFRACKADRGVAALSLSQVKRDEQVNVPCSPRAQPRLVAPAVNAVDAAPSGAAPDSPALAGKAASSESPCVLCDLLEEPRAQGLEISSLPPRAPLHPQSTYFNEFYSRLPLGDTFASPTNIVATTGAGETELQQSFLLCFLYLLGSCLFIISIPPLPFGWCPEEDHKERSNRERERRPSQGKEMLFNSGDGS